MEGVGGVSTTTVAGVESDFWKMRKSPTARPMMRETITIRTVRDRVALKEFEVGAVEASGGAEKASGVAPTPVAAWRARSPVGGAMSLA